MRILVLAAAILTAGTAQAREPRPCNPTFCPPAVSEADLREEARQARGREIARQLGFGGVAPKPKKVK